MAKHSHLIHKGTDQQLSTIQFHIDTPSIHRIAYEGFPLHLAVHNVNIIDRPLKRYAKAHTHGQPEINIIIGDSELLYEIGLGDEIYRVAAPAAIWIPAGLLHNANVVSGSGYFVCMILDKKYYAEGALYEPT